MNQTATHIITQYKQAYEKLYHRVPQYLYALDENWVIVNGARMRVIDLQYVVHQLNEEFNQKQVKRQSVLHRLISWLNN